MSLKQFRKLYRLYLIIGGILILIAFVFSILFHWDSYVALIFAAIPIAIFNFIFLSKWKCPTCRKGLPFGSEAWGSMSPDWAISKCGHCGTAINVATPKERAFRDEQERRRTERLVRKRARQGRAYNPAEERARTRKRARIVTLAMIPLFLVSLGLLFLTWHFFVADRTTTQPHIDTVTVEVGIVAEFGGIDWRVLAVEDGRALLFSEYIVERRGFQERGLRYAGWEGSSLREYLNGEFYNGFTSEDRQRIAYTAVLNNANPWRTRAGDADATTDRVFLLSVEEVVQHFGDSGQLWGEPRSPRIIDDEYNAVRIATFQSENHRWWTRSSAPSRFVIAVGGEGQIGMGGTHYYHALGVRPALWLYLHT